MDTDELASRMNEQVERARARGVPDPFAWIADDSQLASRASGLGLGPMRACVAGTRIYVFQVMETVSWADCDDLDAQIVEAAQYLSISVEAVRACVDYAAEHPEQMIADRVGVYGQEQR